MIQTPLLYDKEEHSYTRMWDTLFEASTSYHILCTPLNMHSVYCSEPFLIQLHLIYKSSNPDQDMNIQFTAEYTL
jgi:hypothetical protein